MGVRKYLFFLALFGLSIIALSISAENAAADTHYWDNGGADGKASTGTNWNPDNPVAGDDLYWGAVSTANCNFDTAVSFNSWNILVNYSGIITQGSVNIVIGNGGYLQNGATFTAAGGDTYWVICSSNFVKSGGVLTSYKLNLLMTGINKNLNLASTTFIHSLNVTGSINVLQTFYIRQGGSFANSGIITIATTKILSIDIGCFPELTSVTSTGSINAIGTGSVTFNFWDLSTTAALGKFNINCPLVISGAALSANRILNLIGDLNSTSSITISSGHATYTITLKLSGKYLNCSSLSINTRGIVDADNSIIKILYLFDAVNGTYTPDTSKLIIQDGGVAKFGTAKPYNMELVSTGLSNMFGIYATTGTVFWNTSGMSANHLCNYYINTTYTAQVTTSAGGIVALNHTVVGMHTFELREVPLITASPSPTIVENVTYSSTLTADQAGTWTMTTNASFLSFNTGTHIVSGTPDSFDVGHSYYISINITNTNGIDYENWTLTVRNGFNTDPVLVGNAGWNYEYRVGTDMSDNGEVIIYFLFTANTDLKFSNTTKIVSGIFTDSGIVNCSISAMDAHGSKIWQNWTIIVGGYRWNPAVSIIYHVDAVTLTVTFDPRFQDNRTITGVMWNFGDGNGSKEEAPMHRYAAPGTYTVTLAAFDKWGNMGWFTTDITVGSEAPISVEERTEWWIDNQASGAILVFIGALVIASLYVGVIGPRKGGVHWAIMLLIGAVALVLILQIYGVIA